MADPDLLHECGPLPVGITSGEYPVVSYQWSHVTYGTINGILVIPMHPVGRWAYQLRRRCPQRFRPDLQRAVIVDSGQVCIAGETSLTVTSGFGDGYYPVFGIYGLPMRLCSLVIDFELWRVKRYHLMANQTLDEYQLPVVERNVADS